MGGTIREKIQETTKCNVPIISILMPQSIKKCFCDNNMNMHEVLHDIKMLLLMSLGMTVAW